MKLQETGHKSKRPAAEAGHKQNNDESHEHKSSTHHRQTQEKTVAAEPRRGKKGRGKKSGGIFIEAGLLASSAFAAIRTASALKVLFAFLAKRHMQKSAWGGVTYWAVTNNGQLVYTYKEAADRGLSVSTFRRSLDELIGLGFLDIAAPGGLDGGLNRPTLYALGSRWRAFGTPAFEAHERPRGVHVGYRGSNAERGKR